MKRGEKKAQPAVGDANDPEGLYAWMVRYLEALRVRNYSERTLENRESYLRLFIAWCDARSLGRPVDITKPILERYQRHLFHHRQANGKALSFGAQSQRMLPLRAYFKWLTRQNVLLWNPASEVELPRQEKRLPKHVLTATEAAEVLSQPDVNTVSGLRDRAILEVLYSTGIRRMEVIHLAITDVDAERGTVTVRQGKGKKDRMVPIGEQATRWVEKYVEEARPKLVMSPDEGVLFLTQDGEAMRPDYLTQLARGYVRGAEIGKTGACHLFRHTCATLMHEGGADIRVVQEMLGHAELSTTEIYTRVAIRRLKLVHSLTHPSAKLEGANDARGPKAANGTAKGLVKEEAVEILSLAAVAGVAEAERELFAQLAEEAEEEDEVS